MDSYAEFLELAQQLSQERLFVASEKQYLQNLNEKVLKTVERLFNVAWVTKQQRINLDGLIFSKPDSTPSACCQRANILEDVKFVDCYKHLGVHEAEYGEFLQTLRMNPGLISMYLTAGERLNLTAMHHLVNVIVDSIYGHCLLQEDEHFVLQLLKHLMDMQLATNENPRRLLRHGTCAFSRVYKVFNEGLFTAKLFLTGALHDAIMNLLMEDDLFLDIDPSKAAVRFPQHERLRRFGKEGTTQYITNLQKYRNWTISKLVNLANKFVAGIRNNLHCFPSSLLWLVKQLYNLVIKAQKVEIREVGAMCADLVFAFFICPAIVNPEPYGICDAHISYIARFNLMQVAQILQVLAMAKWEDIDPKLMDLYGKFDRNCMSSVLDLLLEGGVNNSPPVGPQVSGLVRSAMLITESDLHFLIRFLYQVHNDAAVESWVDKKSMQKILDSLPKSAIVNSQINGSTAEPATTPQTSSFNSKKSLLGKVGKTKSKTNVLPTDDQASPNIRSTDGEDLALNNSPIIDIEDVLVVNLNVTFESPGMLSESKVLSLEQAKQNKVKLNLENNDVSTQSMAREMQEKRTRFSLSHDQDSIGNASDNFEAISEAASNHSVSSSLELENENENDNLSDMISANVSGRGTPNVSGRDTPSSQVEGDERDCEEPEPRPLDLPVTAQKQNREDISDKFGKFEIKNLIGGDETVSLVSDTWSTDVLASDSETVEQADRQQDDSGSRRNVMGPHLGHNLEIGNVVGDGLLTRVRGSNTQDILETASEAWSTDVLASDSERLLDVDTDDTSSIARSDDTASLYRSDDIPPPVDVVISAAAGIKISDTDATVCLDFNEQGDNVTPRASGSHSPVDGPNITNSSISWLNVMHGSTGFKPIDESEHGGLNEPQYSLMECEFNGIKETENCNRSKAIKTMENSKHTQNKVTCALTSFDPLAKRKSTSKRLASKEYMPLSDDINGDNIEDVELVTPCRVAFIDTRTTSHSRAYESSSVVRVVTQEMADDGLYNTGVNADVTNMETDVNGSSSVIKEENEFEHMMDDVECIYPSVTKEGAPSYSVQTENRNLNGTKDMTFDFGSQPKLVCTGFSDRNSSLLDARTTSGRAANVKTARLSTSSSVGSSSSSNCSIPGELLTAGSNNLLINDVRLENNASTDGNADAEGTLLIESHPLPTASSGAIPKTISFDKTAEKGDKDLFDNEDPKSKKGFFRTLKMSLKRPSKRTNRYHDEKVTETLKNESPDKFIGGEKPPQESSDDILAKYRQKPYRSPDSTINENSLHEKSGLSISSPVVDDEELLPVGENTLEESYAFIDAKRKLRLVLSTADVQAVALHDNPITFRVENSSNKNDSKLVGFLKMQLAEAINLQDRSFTAQLHETLRCISIFDKNGCNKLFKSLWEDYNNRHPYIAYLIQCRQSFLSALSHLERLMKTVERDKAVCNKYMIAVCVRLFLEKVERLVQRFMEEFLTLTVSDEKTDFLEQFLQFLYKQMESDPIWQGASNRQLEQAKGAIERSIMGKLYTSALYPNGDGDVHRDQVLNEHIQKLSNVITPNHKDLRIPKIYHYECPWPSAQAEIKTINAYKTPGDKLQCVVRCCTTIMNLLSMANQKSVPAADDFIPVLVYIIIKANPTSLLSTIQYVNSFYEKQLKGEDEYWWTQFCSAVEFIKTMDYNTA